MTTWHDITTPPDSERRVLVAQDDGYIEMAEWTGKQFVHDYEVYSYGMPRPSVPRARYWCDLPSPPQKENP